MNIRDKDPSAIRNEGRDPMRGPQFSFVLSASAPGDPLRARVTPPAFTGDDGQRSERVARDQLE